MRSSMYYDMDGKPIKDMFEWSRMFEKPRHIGLDEDERFRVSTVWLGLDHGFDDGPPLIFETMVFSKRVKCDGGEVYCDRYSTRQEALQGHQRALRAYTGWRGLLRELGLRWSVIRDGVRQALR